jgi:deoxyadenosine/deoxycytidine kinase
MTIFGWVGDSGHIAIEGPPSVGKTALARLLAERFGARAVLDAANPFDSGLQARLFTLLNRHQQRDAFQQIDMFARGGVISDYLFVASRLHAQVSLGRDELALYDKVLGLLGRDVLRPDLVVYLQARPDVLTARRRKAGNRTVSPSDAERISAAYSEFFFHHTDSPLLVVNTSEIDFVEHRPALDDLAAVIHAHKTRKGGVHHYSPLGSQ